MIVEAPEIVIVMLKTPKMNRLLKKVEGDVVESTHNHVLITLNTLSQLRHTYGVIAEITSELSKKGISVELVSAASYLHFLVDEKDSEEAYKCIKSVVRGAKQALPD